ncbi:hypothetical protein AOLI_G00000280 [Acnodon oligacanthus]
MKKQPCGEIWRVEPPPVLRFKPGLGISAAGLRRFQSPAEDLGWQQSSRRVDGPEWVSSSSTSRVEDITRGFETSLPEPAGEFIELIISSFISDSASRRAFLSPVWLRRCAVGFEGTARCLSSAGSV